MGSTTNSIGLEKAVRGYRRLTMKLPEDMFTGNGLQAIEQDCTVTNIIAKLLE